MAAAQWWLTFTCQNTDLNTCGRVVSSAGQPPHAGLWAIYGPYADKATAQFALSGSVYKQETPVWSKPGYSSKSPLIPNPAPILGSSAGGLLAALGTWSLWKRILEVIFGGVLLIGGILHLTGAGKTVIEVAGLAARGAAA